MRKTNHETRRGETKSSGPPPAAVEISPQPRVPATVSGPHAASIAAWRRSEVPLSQWELSERGDSLMEANKLANSLAHERAKEGLSKLLTLTEKASRGKARWQERPGVVAL